MTTPASQFDPGRYITRVSGTDYLEVKWRLLWLRQTHPDAVIETDLVSHSDQTAVFRARVSIPNGGSATGWGTESLSDFRDYLEKAETRALGRALAALGFGVQFCNDFSVDTEQRGPAEPFTASARQSETPKTGEESAALNIQEFRSNTQAATERQLRFIEGLARELAISDDALKLECETSFGSAPDHLGRRDASILIERLRQRRAEQAAATA